MKRKRLLLFFLPYILFHLAANFAHPVTPAFIVERQLDSSMFGIALAAMMTMNFLFSPLWGRLCSYIPTRRVMMVSGVGYAVGQVFFLFATTEWLVIAGRLFAGVFVGGAFTAFSNYIVNTSADSRERDTRLTLMVTVQSIASACGYFIGGMLGELSTEAALIAQIICLAVSGILLRLLCMDDTPFKVRPDTALRLRDTNPFGAFFAARQFMTPMLLLIFVIIAISSVGQNSYEQCFNYFIRDQYGMTSAYNGTFKALIALVTLALNATVCVWLVRKTDINRSFAWVLAACTGLIGVILIFKGQILFVAIYIIYSSVNVIRLPLLQSMIASRADAASRNTLMGFHQSMNSLGGIFGALFAGIIYDGDPMRPFVLAFAAYAAALAIGVVYTMLYKKETRNRK